MVRSPSTFHSVGLSGLMAVLTKVQVGWFSTSKKSLVRRWLSRFSSRVSTLPASMVTDTLESSGFSASSSVPSYLLKAPRTLDTAMWRTVKPRVVCMVSSAYVPTAGYSTPSTVLLVTSVSGDMATPRVSLARCLVHPTTACANNYTTTICSRKYLPIGYRL